MRRVDCTPELAEQVATYIQSGTYDYVAAIAIGISSSTFYEWMKGGTPEKNFFRDRVEQARMMARAACEIVVHRDNALAWLMRGPGRERPGAPGWTSQVAVTGKDGGVLETAVQTTNPDGAAKAEDYAKLSVEEMRQLRALRAKLSGAAPETPPDDGSGDAK